MFSRLGPYRRGLLDELAYAGRRRRLFEYWGHEASLLPVTAQPLFRWRMERAAAGAGDLCRHRPVRARAPRLRCRGAGPGALTGPLAAGELTGAARGEGGWWGWGEGKMALEFLFWAGQVTTATRRGFERVYDLPERALPGGARPADA